MRVLILDLDTLRPDHLGCYGYHRETSPNLDRIASEGVRFNSYFCPDAPCLPSRSALLTGQFGIHTGIINLLQNELRDLLLTHTRFQYAGNSAVDVFSHGDRCCDTLLLRRRLAPPQGRYDLLRGNPAVCPGSSFQVLLQELKHPAGQAV